MAACKKNLRLVLKVMKHMALCHISAYRLIHEIRKEKGWPGQTMVGVANHLRVFDAYNKTIPWIGWLQEQWTICSRMP